jgi:hypothetical protein
MTTQDALAALSDKQRLFSLAAVVVPFPADHLRFGLLHLDGECLSTCARGLFALSCSHTQANLRSLDIAATAVTYECARCRLSKCRVLPTHRVQILGHTCLHRVYIYLNMRLHTRLLLSFLSFTQKQTHASQPKDYCNNYDTRAADIDQYTWDHPVSTPFRPCMCTSLCMQVAK